MTFIQTYEKNKKETTVQGSLLESAPVAIEEHPDKYSVPMRDDDPF